jgi:hypothetical protein
MKNLEPHAHRVGQDDIGRNRIGDRHRDDPRQPAVGDLEHHEYGQPDADDSDCRDEQALQKPFHRSCHLINARFG